MFRNSTPLVCLLATVTGLNACATSEAELDAVSQDMHTALQHGDLDLAWQHGEDFAGTPFNSDDEAPSRSLLTSMIIGEYFPHPEVEGTVQFIGRMGNAAPVGAPPAGGVRFRSR